MQLIADAGKDDYRFAPASLTVRPNDVIVFRVATGAPHSIVFEGEGLSPGVRGAINSAMPGRSGDLSSPLLTAVGKEYRMVVPQVPAGNYQFYCLPHRAYDMRGDDHDRVAKSSGTGDMSRKPHRKLRRGFARGRHKS